MISWLQTNLQKHFRVLFVVLLVVIVVAFVFTIGAQPGISGAESERMANLRFFDTEMNSESKRLRAQRDAELSSILSGNQGAGQFYLFERLTALHVANQHRIPEPDGPQLEDYIKSRPIFRGASGQFDPRSYTMIVDSLKLGGRATEADLRRVLVDDYRIEKVYSALSGATYVDEAEVLEALQARRAQWTVMVAKADLSDYQPEIEITEENLRAYYEQNKSRYDTPPRRSVHYLEFDPSNYIDDIRPTEEEQIAYFEENYDRYLPEPAEPAEGEEAPEEEPVTFEQARSAVRADLRRERANSLAMERAHDAVVSFIENEVTIEGDSLQNAVQSMGLELKRSAPFARTETPIGTVWNQDVVRQAFDLTEDRFYSEPIPFGEGAIVLFYHEEIPSATPNFETIRPRVTADLQSEELRRLRIARAEELKTQLSQASADEESFGAAAEEAGLTVEKHADFTLSEPPEGLDPRLLNALAGLEAGEVSDMARLDGPDSGAFVYALSKEVPSVDQNDPEYQEIHGSLANLYARFTTSQYIETLMGAELERSGFAANRLN